MTEGTHGLLMERANALMGCTENSPEEAERTALSDVIEAYERQRWPLGKIPAQRLMSFRNVVAPTSHGPQFGRWGKRSTLTPLMPVPCLWRGGIQQRSTPISEVSGQCGVLLCPTRIRRR